MKRFLGFFVVGAVTLIGFALADGREPMSKNLNHMDHGTTISMQAMNKRDVAALKPLRGKTFDVEWTQRMVDHHQMAIHMAQYVLEHGQDARVTANAKQVIIVQQGEIDRMLVWLKSWGANLPMSQTHQMPTLNLKLAPNQSVDRWFLSDMIPHHQGALDMAKLVTARTKSTQIRQLAQNILKTQQAEINQYRQWLKDLK